MYLDSICDGILKGLDQQKFTFFTAVSDSLLRIVLIIIFVPRFSMNGFLAIMILSNAYTCFLHVGKLLKLTSIKLKPIKDIILPIFYAVVICYICNRAFAFLSHPILFVAVFTLFSCALFATVIIAFKIVDIHDYI